MSGDIDVPFVPNPDSTTVRTGSYTIPAGKYAYVTPESYDSDFTIDGSTALQTKYYNINGSVPSVPGGGAKTLLTTNNNLGPIRIKGVTSVDQLLLRPAGGAAANDVVIFDQTVPDDILKEIIFNNGDSLYFLNNGGLATASYTVTGYKINHSSQTGFWVPSGTALNGDRYTVAEFNEIQ